MPNSTNKVYSDITLYVDKLSNNKPTYIYAKQNDINSRFVNITIMGASGKINITGTPRLNATLPDGTKKHVTGVANEDGTVTVGLKSQILSLVGCVECDISILSVGTSSDEGNAILTTSSFFVMVGESNFESESGEAENDIYKVTNVTLYGAKGDGVTDDTEAIQSAFTSAHDGVIYFPAGTYIISDQVFIGVDNKTDVTNHVLPFEDANLIIRGDGEASIIKVKENCNPKRLFDARYIRNCTFENLTFEGSSYATRTFGIEITACEDVTVKDCTFRNFPARDGAVHDSFKEITFTKEDGTTEKVTYTTKNFRVINCKITNSGSGIVTYTNETGSSQIESCYIENCHYYGIRAQLNSVITNNVIKNLFIINPTMKP